MAEMYVKHPNYMGKQLSLHVGSGQRTIFDNEVLEGAAWARFVAGGFLRKCSPEEVEQVLKGRTATVKAPQEAGATPEPEKKPEPPQVKTPASREEMLSAMTVEDLYHLAQEMDLSGRSSLKSDKDALMKAILEQEEADAKAEAEKVEAEAKAQAESDKKAAEAKARKEVEEANKGTTKSPAAKVQPSAGKTSTKK